LVTAIVSAGWRPAFPTGLGSDSTTSGRLVTDDGVCLTRLKRGVDEEVAEAGQKTQKDIFTAL
jgi:hypothetical protein